VNSEREKEMIEKVYAEIQANGTWSLESTRELSELSGEELLDFWGKFAQYERRLKAEAMKGKV
jgi:hypothetical protein